MNPTLLSLKADFYLRAQYHESLAEWLRDHFIRYTDVEPFIGTIGMVACSHTRGGRFDFSDLGEPSIVLEVLGLDAATVIDLCAWPVAAPDRPATAIGAAPGLGFDRIRNPASYFLGSPLRAFRTPLAWLQCGCEGIVVVDWEKAIPHLAGALGPLCFDSELEARRAWRRLKGHIDPRLVAWDEPDEDEGKAA